MDFAADTAFERYALERAAPLMPREHGTSVIELGDLGSASVAIGPPPALVRVGLFDTAGSGPSGRSLSDDDIRPLLFGAAWKVIDQLIEFALEAAYVPHDRGRHYTIALKIREAANINVMAIRPFNTHIDLWSRIMKTHASLETLRNSLAHRRIIVDASTGAISGIPNPGQPALRPLTVDEQSAFCRVAVGVAEGVISVTLTARKAAQLSWNLDQLVSCHGLVSLGASSAHGIVPLVIVRSSPNATDEITLNFADVTARARAAVQGVSHYDVEIHLPDGRRLTGALEEAPAAWITFPRRIRQIGFVRCKQGYRSIESTQVYVVWPMTGWPSRTSPKSAQAAYRSCGALLRAVAMTWSTADDGRVTQRVPVRHVIWHGWVGPLATVTFIPAG